VTTTTPIPDGRASSGTRLRGLAFPMVLLLMVVAWFGLSTMMGRGAGAPQAGGEPGTATAPDGAVGAPTGDLTPREPNCTAGSVVLTFDDGPDDLITPAVLDVLRDWQATATFFVIGDQVQARPDLVRRAAEEGHAIGNHTWSHADLTGLDPEGVREELVRTSDAIAAAVGAPPTLWRPPFGSHDAAVDAEAEDLGLQLLWWSEGTDGLDWQGLAPRAIADRVVGNAEPGSIVLLHDIHQNSLDALPLVLQGLHEKGLCAR
jgi:peptidoglycan-N-acetylglucosamine deacetylase